MNADLRNAEGLPPLLNLRGEESAVFPYIRAVRGHWPIVVAVALAALAGAGAWLLLRAPTYEARADVLVTPLPPDTLLELGDALVRDSGDPTRTVQTAAALIDSRQVAGLVAEALGPGWSPSRVQRAVAVEPQGESNVLVIAARVESPGLATEVANAFAKTALGARDAAFSAELATAIRKVRAQQRALVDTAAGPPPALAEKLAELRSVKANEEPTLSLLDQATPPKAPVGAPPWLVLALALIAGVTLGALAALLMEALGRRSHRGRGAAAEGDAADEAPVAHSAPS